MKKLACTIAALALLGGGAEARRATVVQLWPQTILCMSYESAVIARQSRQGTLKSPLAQDCGVFGFRQNVAVLIDGHIKYVTSPQKDGTYVKYWVSDDDVGGVASED